MRRRVLVAPRALAASAGDGLLRRRSIRQVARRFGVGSAVALIVLVVTGALMASHYHRWGNHDLQVKLGLVVVVGVLIAWHTRKPELHVLEGLVFLVSLAIVWLGIAVAHF